MISSLLLEIRLPGFESRNILILIYSLGILLIFILPRRNSAFLKLNLYDYFCIIPL
jgi:hypothetical protein